MEGLKTMTLIIWKCIDCESQTYHKGLCRTCTKYDSSGKIITPKPRVRVNQDGTLYMKSTPLKLPTLSSERFNRSKKPTKKQLRKLERDVSKYIPPKSGQVMLMGESDDEEE